MTVSTGITASGTVVLLSGGLDSVAALHWAVNNRPLARIRAVGFRWGQPNCDAELTAAGLVASALGVRFTTLALADTFATERPSGLLHGVPDHDPDAQGIHRAFVTGRNVVFLSVAAVHACAWFPTGNVELVMGCNRDDAMFPDCKSMNLAEHVASMRKNFAREIRLVLPFIDWTKEQIVANSGSQARIDIARSWSCYRGAGPCGKCSPCVLRAAAFAFHGIEDRCASPAMFGGDPARCAK